MPERRFLSLFALLIAGLLTGCASSSPSQNIGSDRGEPIGRADTSQQHAPPRQAPAESPRESEAIAELRTAYIDRAYAEVVRTARESLNDSSLSASQAGQVYAFLGRAHQAQGAHQAAVEALQRARVKTVEAGETVTHIDRALGESYAALYQWEQAESAFQRALAGEPTDHATRRALAEVYVRSRDWRSAQEQYTRLVQADSSNGQWWARLGRCALERNQVARARQYFAEAHHRLPQAPDVALPLSRLYRAAGKNREAERVIDTTISHQPSDPRLWRRRADFAFERDDLETAREAYTRTLALGDSSATVFRRIGLIEVRQEQYEQAVAPLRQAYRKNSRHSRTTLYLGIAYRHLDSLRQASEYLRQTIEQEAGGPITTAFIERAETKDQQADVTAAVRAYKTALRLQPERTEVYFRLAHVYDRHYQEKATAARYYQRFLRASDTTQVELRTYAETRLETLRPVLHMQEKEVQTADSSTEQ